MTFTLEFPLPLRGTPFSLTAAGFEDKPNKWNGDIETRRAAKGLSIKRSAPVSYEAVSLSLSN